MADTRWAEHHVVFDGLPTKQIEPRVIPPRRQRNHRGIGLHRGTDDTSAHRQRSRRRRRHRRRWQSRIRRRRCRFRRWFRRSATSDDRGNKQHTSDAVHDLSTSCDPIQFHEGIESHHERHRPRLTIPATLSVAPTHNSTPTQYLYAASRVPLARPQRPMGWQPTGASRTERALSNPQDGVSNPLGIGPSRVPENPAEGSAQSTLTCTTTLPRVRPSPT